MLLKRILSTSTLLVALLLALQTASAQDSQLYRPDASVQQRDASRGGFRTPNTSKTTAQSTVENGLSCTTITFEGIGDLSPIPDFEGITSPGWLGLIDADAGGSGNFAFEPSPETIAFWLGGTPGSRDIVFINPVSKVEFFYASFVTVRLDALDAAGNILASAFGPPNFNQGPGGDPTGTFNKWDPLRLQILENKIARVRVSGNVNQTAIDNLKVCRAIGINSVEVTQAIQEWQELNELKSDLQGDREPPVPIIKGKPAVIRVYLNQLQEVTTVRIELSGVTNQSKMITVQPQCTPELRRRGENGCRSVDFYFIPPGGEWQVTVKAFDSNNTMIESEDLPFVSRDSDSLILRSVSICDARDSNGNWQCTSGSALGGMIDFLRRTAPTDSVSVSTTNNFVRRDTANYDADSNGILSSAEMNNWWSDTIRDVHNDFTLFDLFLTLFGQQRYYYGLIRPTLSGSVGGMAHDIPSRGAGSRSSVIRLGVETAQEVVAHETGHMLGRRHTNKDVPLAVGGSPPGCYSLAADLGTDWPFPNNRIQSTRRLEVGFDVSSGRPVLPENTFDWMSYCTPRWISPFTYRNAMATLGATSSSSSAPASRSTHLSTTTTGLFWTVSGLIRNGLATFDPLFSMNTRGPSDSGIGSHRIEVRAGDGTVLFTRFFTPNQAVTESLGEDLPGVPGFFELIPISSNATRIVVINDAAAEIGTIQLNGIPPIVNIISPQASAVLSGTQQVNWSVSDPDSTFHTSRIFYSDDGGAHWSLIGQVQQTNSLRVDFDTLPGSSRSSLLLVAVSDGINTGSAQSAIFSVTKKSPTAEIIFPQPNSIFKLHDLVWLRVSAFDGDDGFLDGASVHWESSQDGALGTGASLPITSLRAGLHLITMTATDSDGSSVSRSVTIRVADSPPVINLTVRPLNILPTTCVEVTVDAQAGSVDLASVEYSLNGGSTWSSVPLGRLPFTFSVPGQGFFHVVARAFDVADQIVAKDSKFFIDAPCANSPPIANAGPDQRVECQGLLTSVRLDGTASTDPDHDPLTYEWFEGTSLGTGSTLDVNLGLGLHTITLIVTDPTGASSSDTVNVNIVDTSPPLITDLAISPNALWPPSHLMVDVTVGYNVIDTCCAASAFLAITSNEAINGTGDGDTAPDWEIIDEHHVRLRAERAGTGSGRVYTITLTVGDCAGNRSYQAIEVSVPKSQVK